jgi:hypothetical protein
LSFDDADTSKPALRLKIKFGKETAGDKKYVFTIKLSYFGSTLFGVICILNVNRLNDPS